MDEHTIIEHAGQFNEAVSALIEMEGMKALNQERQINNQAPGGIKRFNYWIFPGKHFNQINTIQT